MPELTPLEMQQCYRNVFGTPEGRLVLGDILGNICHFGLNLLPNDPVMVAEYNIGLTIARTACALDQVYPQLGIAVVKEKADGGR